LAIPDGRAGERACGTSRRRGAFAVRGKIDLLRSQHEKKDILVEGLFHQGNLVAVICEEGLCCAFAMEGRCNVGKGVSPEDGKKLAVNIAVYALRD
jgi:hypothetical protein